MLGLNPVLELLIFVSIVLAVATLLVRLMRWGERRAAVRDEQAARGA